MNTGILGADISKPTFHVSLLVDENKPCAKVFDNGTEGFESPQRWLKQQGVEHLHACLESTSTYW
jgi:transposase